jgi:hypothetical protein
MISMSYDPRCETIRFVWRKVRFVFAAFWPNRGPKRNGPRGRRDPGAAGRATFPGSLRSNDANADSIHRFSQSRFEAFKWRPIASGVPKAAPQNEVFVDETKGAKSWAKSQLRH